MTRRPVRAAAAALAAAALAAAAGPPAWKEQPRKTVLTTGLPLIYQQDEASPMTVVGLFVPGGRAAVPEGLDGLATLATRLALELPDEDKVRDLMAQSTRLTFLCEADFSAVFIECLSENLEAALRVAGKVIPAPLMSGPRIGRAKEMMALAAESEADDAVAAGSGAAASSFFRGRGYGSSGYGSAASRKAIGRKDVLDFHRRFFTSTNVFFAVVSDLDRGTVQGFLEKHFSGFPGGGRPDVPAAAPARPADLEVRLAKEAKQTYIGRAWALPAPTPGDHARGSLAEVLIGRGPGSRLWDLRAVERLAYNVGARLSWMRGAGILEAFLETGSSKAGRAVGKLDGTLRELWDKGVSADELEAAKTMAKADFLRSAETKVERTRLFGRFEVIGLGFEHISGFFGAVDAVTAEDLNSYIRTVLDPGKALKITVGPGRTGAGQGG